MKNPLKENFQVKKIKLPNAGGMDIEFDITEVIGAESYQSSQSHKSSKEPHPDLSENFEKMAPMVAQVFGFTIPREVVFKKEFDSNISQKEYISRAVDELTANIRITGISISGKDDNIGVVISSSYAVDNKQRVALNTPRIMLNGSSRGFEEKLRELIESIKNEAYEFVFNRKVANPEIFEYAEA
jgi:pantothenate synthetase